MKISDSEGRLKYSPEAETGKESMVAEYLGSIAKHALSAPGGGDVIIQRTSDEKQIVVQLNYVPSGQIYPPFTEKYPSGEYFEPLKQYIQGMGNSFFTPDAKVRVREIGDNRVVLKVYRKQVITL